jgi:hypothetical protein
MDVDGTRLARWVERTIGGRVSDVRRLPRWRPAWDLDVEVGGRLVPLHARGEREPEIVMPYRIADEVATHDLLESHGVPVPHAYGLCDDPYALVMDRLPGHVDLSSVEEHEREQLLGEYLEILARIYAIPLDAASAAGFALPVDSAECALGGYWQPMVARYDSLMEDLPPDPIAVFLRRWMEENAPPGRREAARFITYDSFQFMFADGRISGLLDFEHAHVGDPLMDLSALRIRDTIKNIGELAATAARYERDPVAIPGPRPSRHAPALGHLAASLRALAASGDEAYELTGLGRVAHHLKRVDEIGIAVEAANLDDLERVLGHRPDADQADAELLDLLARSGAEREEEIVRLLDARAQRLHLEMASPTSLMLRHPRLRSLRADRPFRRDPNDGWPAGAIPGTA